MNLSELFMIFIRLYHFFRGYSFIYPSLKIMKEFDTGQI